MTTGLNINRLVRVTVNLAPLSVGRRSFGTLMLAGDSNVIDVGERYRSYTTLDAVADDFGTSAPEYLAAALYYGQSPKPLNLQIGRWARAATAGLNKGGIVPVADQAALLAALQAIGDGTFEVSIDGGAATEVTALDFTAVTNLNGAAAVIDAGLAGATVAWSGSRFVVTSATTGVNSSVGYAAAQGTGTDLSATLKLTAATGAVLVDGVAAETAVAGVTALADASGQWYGLAFACSTFPDDDAMVDVAAFIEGATPSRIFGVTTDASEVLDGNDDTDIASRLSALEYRRSLVLYSANANAVASLFGRAFSVDFNANRSVITLMYKQLPGVTSELLSETQAQALKAKRCNVYVAYSNDTAILQYGVMSGDAYIDEQHGLDWLADAIATALWNLFYTSKRKVPQTDSGQHELLNAVTAVLADAINNGLVAPGTWNADGFGQLSRGDYLAEGFYVYSAPIASQAQETREQRIAPAIQVAVKLAGAFHEVDCQIDVNR